MPKIIKKRPEKKKSADETEVATHARHALDAIKAKQRQTITVISVIAVAVFLLVAVKFYMSSQSEKLLDLQRDAFAYYYKEKPYDALPDGERWKKALELFQKSVDIKMNPTALFYLGNCYFNLGDYENAIRQYTLFSDKLSGEYETLPLVYQKLASAYFKTGKNDKALETLGKLEQMNNGNFKDTALLMEARYYESKGDTAKALERYKTLSSEFPASPWSAEATAKVTQGLKKEEPAAAPQMTPPQPVTK